jgi:hypothetical protein
MRAGLAPIAVASSAVSSRLNSLLEKLEDAKRLRPSRGRVERRLDGVVDYRFPDPESLIRYHEAALFLRAYPQTRAVLRRAERALASIGRQVARLEQTGADLSPLDTPEVSGIAGTAVTTDYSYDVVRWLAARHPGQIEINWEAFEGADRLRALWPDFLPLLEEEALEDANVPYLDWLGAGKRRPRGDLAWLLERIGKLRLPQRDKA